MNHIKNILAICLLVIAGYVMLTWDKPIKLVPKGRLTSIFDLYTKAYKPGLKIGVLEIDDLFATDSDIFENGQLKASGIKSIHHYFKQKGIDSPNRKILLKQMFPGVRHGAIRVVELIPTTDNQFFTQHVVILLSFNEKNKVVTWWALPGAESKEAMKID